MSLTKNTEKLQTEVRKNISRMEKAEKDRRTLLAQTAYLGTLGVVIALPIVAGAYLGHWLDEKLSGFSFSWTVCLIVLGVFMGTANAYIFIRKGES